MFGKFIKEEKGMTMALTIFMIVIIGVMGAGLLTFVQKDLESVVEVNKGQNAFEMADAGVQAAQQQIRRDADPEHYDVDGLSGPLPALEYLAGCNDPDGDSTSSPRAPAGENWSPAAGVTRNVPGSGKFTVTIRWMNRTPAADAACRAPVLQGFEPAKARFFRVVSSGEFNGAKRKVEAIVSTVDAGVPQAYFTPEDIKVNGSACITDTSMFSLGNITLNGGGSGCSGGGKIQGQDLAYGKWKNTYNVTERGKSEAGFGTSGSIDSGLKVSGRDYDAGTNPKFVQDRTPNSPPAGEITFPFDYKAQRQQGPGSLDAARLAFYEAEAKLQEASDGQVHYFEKSSNGQPRLDSWPANSTDNTIVYVKFPTGGVGDLRWGVNGNCNNPADTKRGILVVDNGSFKLDQHTARLTGYVFVRGGTAGVYDDTGGNTCFDGYANASGDIEIRGNVSPSVGSDVSNSPGFYDVRVWSWRECDEAAAGSC